jgi:Xaa-Pro aminopeptidase
MVNEELERARAELKKIGADWALLSSAENVTYVSHYEVPIDFGPLAHLSYGPVMALVGVEEPATYLIANSYYAAGARKQTPFDEVLGFDILQVFEPYERQVPGDNFVATVRQAFKQAGLGWRGQWLGQRPATAPSRRPATALKLAVEGRTLPLAVLRILEELANVEIIEAAPALDTARRIKTNREIGLLKKAAEVVNVGHKELMKQARQAGKSEFELWSAITQAMHEYAGGKLFLSGELVCGPRNKTVAPGGPIDYVTRPGDLAELDVSPRVNGYWADMANVTVIGAEPTEVQKKYARAAHDSFYAGAEALRPGNTARDVFEAARAAYDKYGLQLGHYAGHGIGTTVNEAPWFVPGDETVLEAGMVVCIETGAYAEEASGKCEKMLVIRESGDPDIFPDFEWGIRI